MRLIKPSFEILEQPPGLEGIYKAIERAGRVCYKSEDKITEDSAKKFVDMLIARGHTAMLEHGTIYLNIPVKYIDISEKYDIPIICDAILKYMNNPYSKVLINDISEDDSVAYITTNYRVLVENDWLDDLQYLCEPTEYHEKRVSVKFTTSIGISRELLRHRILPEDWEDLGKYEPNFSYANESTRYCNYSKDSFGNELTFIIPSWTELREGKPRRVDYNISGDWLIYDEKVRADFKYKHDSLVGRLLDTLETCQTNYLGSMNNNWGGNLKPEQAREMLPLATKSDLVMTGFVSDWKKVFDQRVDGTTGNPHPDMVALMSPVKEELIGLFKG